MINNVNIINYKLSVSLAISIATMPSLKSYKHMDDMNDVIDHIAQTSRSDENYQIDLKAFCQCQYHTMGWCNPLKWIYCVFDYPAVTYGCLHQYVLPSDEIKQKTIKYCREMGYIL